MDFQAKTRRSVKIEDTESKYPHALQFYGEPPTEEITLQDFESLAVERLKVLRIVEDVSVKYGGQGRREDGYKTELSRKLNAEQLKIYLSVADAKADDPTEDQEFRRRDHLSHFISRLAFCRNDQLRNWMLDQETELFRVRFMQLHAASKLSFISRNKLPFDLINDDEKSTIYESLNDVYGPFANEPKIAKVYFTEVEQLVRKRKIVLKRGFAYLPLQEIEPLICGIFRSRLSLAMAQMRRILPDLEEDARLFHILKSLPLLYTGKDYNTKKVVEAGAISIEAIDTIAKQSFPPCMKVLQESLQTQHHLKHGGRMQYGLFLKGIGLKLDDSIKYWRREFCKKFSDEEFTKRYLYSIRHNYGEEGKRANYTPYSCLKIIMGNAPGPTDAHGCPFRHYDGSALKKHLTSEKIPLPTTQKILSLVESKHYSIACSCFFEAKHGIAPEQTISHPNQYFEESRRLLEKKQPDKPSKNANSQP